MNHVIVEVERNTRSAMVPNTMKYHKLVRDKIPEHIRSKGEMVVSHVADDAEYWQKLKEKLLEEVQEFVKDESAGEIADLLEVIDAVVEYKHFDLKVIEEIKQKKAEERGRFKDRIILDES